VKNQFIIIEFTLIFEIKIYYICNIIIFENQILYNINFNEKKKKKHRIYPLTEENSLPKALLPIANKPLLYYQLKWLVKAGIQGIIFHLLTIN